MTSYKDLKTLIIEGIHERKGRGVTIIDLSDIETAAASQFIEMEFLLGNPFSTPVGQCLGKAARGAGVE